MAALGRKRSIIDYLGPQVNCGRFSIKRAVGETVLVEAYVFCDGHDRICAEILCKKLILITLCSGSF